MSRENDLNPFEEQGFSSGFEQELQRLSPMPVALDLSAIDQSVAASPVESSKVSGRQWRLAATSWMVGLATGLLVAIVGGGAFRESQQPTDARAGKPAADGGPLMLEPKRPTLTPIAVGAYWADQTDYLAEFSPAIPDSPQRMDRASRELLVGFSIDDSVATAPLNSSQSSQSAFAAESPASLGQLRKELSVAL